MLETFNGLLDEYASHQGYIARAKSQAARFSPAVVAKVIHDHELKASQTAAEIAPLVPSIEQSIQDIDDQRAALSLDKGEADERLEELSLRNYIGELTDDQLEEQSSELREAQESAGEKLASLDEQRGAYADALDRWASMS